jgi:hypothetical protein
MSPASLNLKVMIRFGCDSGDGGEHAAKEVAVKKTVVRLSGEKREQLGALLRRGKSPGQRLLEARILFKADVSEAGRRTAGPRTLRSWMSGEAMDRCQRQDAAHDSYWRALVNLTRAVALRPSASMTVMRAKPSPSGANALAS